MVPDPAVSAGSLEFDAEGVKAADLAPSECRPSRPEVHLKKRQGLCFFLF